MGAAEQIDGAIADGATEAQGYVHGIIPQFLENLEVAHQGITDLTVTTTMHERKQSCITKGCFSGLARRVWHDGRSYGDYHLAAIKQSQQTHHAF